MANLCPIFLGTQMIDALLLSHKTKRSVSKNQDTALFEYVVMCHSAVAKR